MRTGAGRSAPPSGSAARGRRSGAQLAISERMCALSSLVAGLAARDTTEVFHTAQSASKASASQECVKTLTS